MTDLATQQQELLQTLFDGVAANAIEIGAAPAHSTWARGLKAYKSHGHMLAERALLAAYPVLAQLLGDENWPGLARALWHAHPPQRGDLALWGDALPSYLAASPQLQDEPFLADVARVEWAMHRCAVAADSQPDPSSLALMTTEDPDALHLRLAPGCVLVRSPWPVAGIVGAHVHGEPSLAEVGAAMRAGHAQDVVVWRQAYRPQFREALPGEVDLLEHLLAGASLGLALDQSPGLDFAAWLPAALSSQLVLGVTVQYAA